MAAGHVASDLADLHVASLLGCARPAAWRLAEAFGLAAGPKWLVPERHFGMHETGQGLVTLGKMQPLISKVTASKLGGATTLAISE